MSDLNNRLKKVIGQLTGIMKMIDEQQDCEKIIIQFQAAKAALESAFSLSLSTSLKECLQKKENKSVEKILSLLAKK